MEVKRMDYTRYLKLALHGYVHGTRRQGRPKKRWIDMVKDHHHHHHQFIAQKFRENSNKNVNKCNWN